MDRGLGEASAHVSEELRIDHPAVPWRDLVGMRTILAHAYHHIDQDIVGTVVARDIPELRRHLGTVVDSIEPDE